MTKAAKSKEASPSYSNFLSYYQDFRAHYHYCNQIRDRLQACLSLDVKTTLLEEAVQAHIEAVKAHTKVVRAYQELRQKVFAEYKKSIN